MDEHYVDREYKNNVFCDLFSEKRNALSLYNALNHTHYENAEELEIVTLSDVIFMQQKNDVSIMFQNILTLWEHQSTLNFNMPLRGLIYFARNIDGILKSRGITLYGKKLVKIPSPDYYVLYNGTETAPDRQDLRLSDSFITPKEGYEWTAHMLNINAAHNLELLDMCPPLKGYALLVQYTRNFQANGIELKEAIGKAINQCIRENHLKSYLLKKKAEVNLMLLTEFNQEAFARAIRNEGIEEGFEKGIEKGIEEGIEKGIEKGESRLNQLNFHLISDKRFDDLARATNDRQYQAQLYKEYGL